MKTGFILPESCPRGRTNCNPYAQIVSDGCESFFCVGLHDGSLSKVLQDKYTVCFKGEHDDSISMYDKRDIIHNAAVLIQAAAIIEEGEHNMTIEFTSEELKLVSEMFDALQDGFEYFTEDNAEVFQALQSKVESNS